MVAPESRTRLLPKLAPQRSRGRQLLVRLAPLFLCFVLLIATLPPSSEASDDTSLADLSGVLQSRRDIREVDRAIYLKLIELSRFNIRYHLAANYHQKWRSFTYPLAREAGTACSFAASLNDIDQQAGNIDNPARISKNAIKNSIACTITGNAISGSASGIELAQNTWVMLRARKGGFSSKGSLVHVKELVASFDELLERRNRLIEKVPLAKGRQVRSLESQLLRHLRNELLVEFREWSCHSRDRAWRENTFYTIDSGQSFLRMSASIIARKALEEPDLAGSAIICATVSNSLATVNPILANLVGWTVRKKQERTFDAQFPSVKTEGSQHNLELRLGELEAQRPDDVPDEFLRQYTFLTDRAKRLDKALERESNEIERFRRVAQQQSVVGPAVGLTGLASSILSATAFYGYRREPITANKLGLSGRISQTTGQSIALVITPYTAIRGALKRRSLSRRGELPEQILERRLRDLDELEARIQRTY